MPERAAVPIDVVVIDAMPVTAVGKIFKPALRLDAMRRAAVKTVRAALGDGSAVRVDVRETEARPAVTLGVPLGATADTAAELLRTAFAGTPSRRESPSTRSPSERWLVSPGDACEERYPRKRI